MSRHVALISSVLIGAGLLAYLFWPRSASQGPETAALDEGTYAHAQGFRYTRSDDGRVEWEVRAREAEYAEDRNVAVFHGVEATFFDAERGTLRMEAPQGRFFVEAQDIEADGGVRLVSSLGYSLSTDSLRYSQSARQVQGDHPVFVKGKGFSLASGGILLDVGQERMELTGEVRGTLWKPETLAETGVDS